MIESAATAQLPVRAEPSAPRRDDAPAFSFAAAVSALETNAARSLEAHGAKPEKGAAIGESGSQARQAANNRYASAEHTPASTTERAAPEKPVTPTLASAPQHSSSPIAAQIPMAHAPASAIAVAPQIAAAPATLQTAAMAAKADAAAIRAADAARASATKAATTPTAANKPDAPTQDFAKLLARRLDAGATQFEFRLDPPSLGRVEAHLKLTDNGENVLELKFEHQTALDLFVRDEAALRNTLTSSGFSFNGEDVVFELAEDTNAAGFSTASLIEQSYKAPWSSGAVDISI